MTIYDLFNYFELKCSNMKRKNIYDSRFFTLEVCRLQRDDKPGFSSHWQGFEIVTADKTLRCCLLTRSVWKALLLKMNLATKKKKKRYWATTECFRSTEFHFSASFTCFFFCFCFLKHWRQIHKTWSAATALSAWISVDIYEPVWNLLVAPQWCKINDHTFLSRVLDLLSSNWERPFPRVRAMSHSGHRASAVTVTALSHHRDDPTWP